MMNMNRNRKTSPAHSDGAAVLLVAATQVFGSGHVTAAGHASFARAEPEYLKLVLLTAQNQPVPVGISWDPAGVLVWSGKRRGIRFGSDGVCAACSQSIQNPYRNVCSESSRTGPGRYRGSFCDGLNVFVVFVCK